MALGGYCAVCLAEDRQWQAGRPEYSAMFDGKRYVFPGPEQQQRFQADPSRYAPALGGDDIVEFSGSRRRVVGRLPLGAAYLDRFYFFSTAENKEAFLRSPALYAKADLALGGHCVVCLAELNQRVAGDPNITAVYQGVRYRFPGEEQRQKFLAEPGRYAGAVFVATEPSTAPYGGAP